MAKRFKYQGRPSERKARMHGSTLLITERERKELLDLIKAHPHDACIEWQRKGYSSPVKLIARKGKKSGVMHYDAVGWEIGQSANSIHSIFATLKVYGKDTLGITHPSLGRQYAIKFFEKSAHANEEQVSAKFNSEQSILNKVDHIKSRPVDILDTKAVIMTYLKGDTLGSVPTINYELIISLLKALKSQVIAKGYKHNDIKPDNIMVSYDEEKKPSIKIFDFDAASEGVEKGGVLGTPGYIAPDRLIGIGDQTKSDLFAMGVAILEIFLKAQFEVATAQEKYMGLDDRAKQFAKLKTCWGNMHKLIKENKGKNFDAELMHTLDECAGYEKLMDDLIFKIDGNVVEGKEKESIKHTILQMLKCSSDERCNIDEAIALFEMLNVDHKLRQVSRPHDQMDFVVAYKLGTKCHDAGGLIEDVTKELANVVDTPESIAIFISQLKEPAFYGVTTKKDILARIDAVKDEWIETFQSHNVLLKKMHGLSVTTKDESTREVLQNLIASLKQEFVNPDAISLSELTRLTDKCHTKMSQIMFELCLLAVNSSNEIKSFIINATIHEPHLFQHYDSDGYGLIEFAVIQDNFELTDFLVNNLKLFDADHELEGHLHVGSLAEYLGRDQIGLLLASKGDGWFMSMNRYSEFEEDVFKNEGHLLMRYLDLLEKTKISLFFDVLQTSFAEKLVNALDKYAETSPQDAKTMYEKCLAHPALNMKGYVLHDVRDRELLDLKIKSERQQYGKVSVVLSDSKWQSSESAKDILTKHYEAMMSSSSDKKLR